MTKKEKREKLLKLYRKMQKDDSLPLKKGATKLVFGEGNVDSDILFVGEGPGYWEDQKGRPFVGNAGSFLNQLLKEADLSREEVFITNVIHYRPPNNRDPEPEELSAFAVYLDPMIEIIDPKVIVTLGRFSMAKFIPNVTISGIHGKVHQVNWQGKDLTVVPMYHPAAGLRNGDIRQKTIDDFRKLQPILNDILKKEDESENHEQLNLV